MTVYMLIGRFRSLQECLEEPASRLSIGKDLFVLPTSRL